MRAVGWQQRSVVQRPQRSSRQRQRSISSAEPRLCRRCAVSKELEGKVALVTGADGGLGQVIAEHLAGVL